MAVVSGANIVDNGLVFHLDAANSKSYPGSGTVWEDMSANNISTVLTNQSANTMTIANGYFEFNPSDVSSTATYWTISNSYFPTIKNETSMETAMYVYDIFGNGQYGRGVSPRVSESGSPYGFSIGSGSLTAEVNTVAGWKTGTYSSSIIGLNKWLLISQVTSVADDSFKTYVNGNLVRTVSLGGSQPTWGGNGFLIGRGFYGGIRNYKGRVAFLRVYNKPLTIGEIQNNFNAVRGRYGI